MLQLDHLTVVAPSLEEGVSHIRDCLEINVPFGQRHTYMGTHNHLLQLGNSVYMEIVAIDPDGENPQRARWFGLDNQEKVREDWNDGRRLRGWVARTNVIDEVLEGRKDIFGQKMCFPASKPIFQFAIPDDGTLPLNGAAPSVIDRYGKSRSMEEIADLGASLQSFTLKHPNPAYVESLYKSLDLEQPPKIVYGEKLCYHAMIKTPKGLKKLT